MVGVECQGEICWPICISVVATSGVTIQRAPVVGVRCAQQCRLKDEMRRWDRFTRSFVVQDYWRTAVCVCVSACRWVVRGTLRNQNSKKSIRLFRNHPNAAPGSWGSSLVLVPRHFTYLCVRAHGYMYFKNPDPLIPIWEIQEQQLVVRLGFPQ